MAEARSEIEQARDAQRPPISQVGNKAASQETAMIKAVAFNMVQTIVDWVRRRENASPTADLVTVDAQAGQG